MERRMDEWKDGWVRGGREGRKEEGGKKGGIAVRTQTHYLTFLCLDFFLCKMGMGIRVPTSFHCTD